MVLYRASLFPIAPSPLLQSALFSEQRSSQRSGTRMRMSYASVMTKMKNAIAKQETVSTDVKNGSKELMADKAIDVITFIRASWKKAKGDMQKNVFEETMEGTSIIDNKNPATSNSINLKKDEKLEGTLLTKLDRHSKERAAAVERKNGVIAVTRGSSPVRVGASSLGKLSIMMKGYKDECKDSPRQPP